MQTVQMPLEAELLLEVDKSWQAHRDNSFGIYARCLAVCAKDADRHTITKHREGYKRMPVDRSEFSGWKDEQAQGKEGHGKPIRELTYFTLHRHYLGLRVLESRFTADAHSWAAQWLDFTPHARGCLNRKTKL